MRPSPDRRSARLAAGPPAARRRRLLAAAAAGLVVTVLAVGAQLVLARAAAQDLTQQVQVAQASLRRLVASPSDQDGELGLVAARAAVASLQADTRRLARVTGSPPLTLAAHVPFVGADVRAAGGLTADVDRLAHDVLPLLVDVVADAASGPRTGPLDAGPVTARERELAGVAHTVRTLRKRTDEHRPRVAVLVRARNDLREGLDRLAVALQPLQTLAAVGHAMTGGEGERRYVVLLQTPAEGRATGGLVGGFVEVVVHDGTLRIVRQGSNAELRSSPSDVVTIPGGYAETWGSYGAQRGWTTANLSPDFPSVAKVWAGLYRRQFGVTVDGVVGATPQALAHLLRSGPPVVLADGTSVTADDVVQLLERGIYDRFPEWQQEPVRNAYQQDLLRRLLQHVLRDAEPGPGTLLAVRDAVADGSLRLASMHPQEQAELAQTAISGSLPRGPGPFVAWTTSNVAANKLDVFLSRRLTYRRQPLGGGRERATATAVLRNDAPSTGLPPYVAGRRLPTGGNEVLLATYLTEGAQVRSVTVDGVPVTALQRVEAGHPVVLVQVPLRPDGGQAEVVVVSEQPASDRPVGSLRQLMSNPDERDVPGEDPAGSASHPSG